MALMDFLSNIGNQASLPNPNALSRFGTAVGNVVNNPALQRLAEQDAAYRSNQHMQKVFAANPSFAQQLYGTQTALEKVNAAKEPQYTKVGSALLKIDPKTGQYEEIYKADADLPSALQIANEMQNQLKIIRDPNTSQQQKQSALERYNMIGQAAKTYGFDRGVEYGLGTFRTPDFNPNANQPSMIPDGGYGAEPPIGSPLADFSGGFPDIASGQGPVLDDMALEQLAQSIPDVSPAITPRAMSGYGEATGSIAADKARMEEQAKKGVQLALDPLIEAEKTGAKSEATYLAEGKQALPLQQRALEAAELRDDFLTAKADEVLAQANSFTTGFGGSLTEAVAGTPAYNLKANVDTLLANAGFDRLQEMRDNSPTGGALGAISEREIGLLQSAAQALQTSQSPEQFRSNLKAFMAQRKRSLENIRKAYEQDYQRFGGASDPYLPAPKSMESKKTQSNKLGDDPLGIR